MIRDVNNIIGLRLSNSLRKMVPTSIYYEKLALIYKLTFTSPMKEFGLVASDIVMGIIWAEKKRISVEHWDLYFYNINLYLLL